MDQSVIINNTTREELAATLRTIVKEELSSVLSSKSTEAKYLTRVETAKLLHITLPTLGEYIKRDLITAHRIGSRILFDEADIAEALKRIPTVKFKRIAEAIR